MHDPGVMAQHADVTLDDGSLIGFFGNPNGRSGNGLGFRLQGVVAEKPWFDANRPYYNNADDAEKVGLVSTYCTLKICPDAAKKFREAWENLKKNTPSFQIMGGNCSARAGSCFEKAGILGGGISGLDTPNHLFEALRNTYGGKLKCVAGYFGYDASGKPYIRPFSPGTPRQPNSKNSTDKLLSQYGRN